jgi:hypothetical protein
MPYSPCPPCLLRVLGNFYLRSESTLHLPDPTAAKYRNTNAYNAASSPPLVIGQKPRGACAWKYATAISPDAMNATGLVNNQRAAHHLDDPCQAHLRHQLRRCRTAEAAEQLRQPVLEKQEAGGDSHQRIDRRGIPPKHLFHVCHTAEPAQPLTGRTAQSGRNAETRGEAEPSRSKEESCLAPLTASLGVVSSLQMISA